MRSGKLSHQTFECSRGIGQSLGYNKSLPNRAVWGAGRSQRDISGSHMQLVITVDKVDCTEHGASNHGVLKHIVSRNRCFSRYGGRIKPIKSMDNAPLAIRLLNTKGRRRMGGLTLSDHSCRVLSTKQSSMTSHCFFGKGHCRVTQYLGPGTRSIFNYEHLDWEEKPTANHYVLRLKII